MDMITVTENQIGVKELTGKKFQDVDFRRMDFRHVRTEHAIFTRCNFDDVDMTEAWFIECQFHYCSFRNSCWYRTKFIDCSLAGSVLAPKEAFGLTWTMSCKTFENVEMSQSQWFYLMMLMTMIKPQDHPVKEPLREKLIALIGAERYVKLLNMFRQRNL